jgi:hypothetical protein
VVLMVGRGAVRRQQRLDALLPEPFTFRRPDGA